MQYWEASVEEFYLIRAYSGGIIFRWKFTLDTLSKYLMEFKTWCIDITAKLSNRNKYSSTITGVIRDNGGIESLMKGLIVNIRLYEKFTVHDYKEVYWESWISTARNQCRDLVRNCSLKFGVQLRLRKKLFFRKILDIVTRDKLAKWKSKFECVMSFEAK
jgi:hypothetical protein